MVNPELLNYVRGQLGAGIARDQIKKALATGGWTEADANDAFNVIDGVRLPTPPPPPPTPGVNPNYQAPDLATQAPPLQPMRPQFTPGAPRTTITPSVSASKQRRKFPWTAIIVLSIVALVGIAIYMAFPWILAQYDAYTSVFNNQNTQTLPTNEPEATPTDTSTSPDTGTSSPGSVEFNTKGTLR